MSVLGLQDTPVQRLLGEGWDPKAWGAPHVSRTVSCGRVLIPANLLILMVNEDFYFRIFTCVQTENKACEKECPLHTPRAAGSSCWLHPTRLHTAQGDPAWPRSPPGPVFLGCFFSEAFTTCTHTHRYASTHIHAHVNIYASHKHRCCVCYQNTW